MILVIGAAASGKTAFVESLGYTEADMAVGVLDDKPVLTNLQALVWQDPEHALEMFDALCAKDVVICDEVGSGVIPVDPQERAAREQCGRLCVLLAKEATRVVRLVCGIPKIIKD